ncbi:unnamed protein product [Ectocarpus sp. 12 AP-2014]
MPLCFLLPPAMRDRSAGRGLSDQYSRLATFSLGFGLFLFWLKSTKHDHSMWRWWGILVVCPVDSNPAGYFHRTKWNRVSKGNRKSLEYETLHIHSERGSENDGVFCVFSKFCTHSLDVILFRFPRSAVIFRTAEYERTTVRRDSNLPEIE